MIKNKEQKIVFLNTKRPSINILSSEAHQYHYLIGSKVCMGNFVVYSSQDDIKPSSNEIYEDELTLKDIKGTLKLDNVYFPIYVRDKIGNARKKGTDNVIDTIDEIVDNYGVYFNLFKEKELYSIISEFFILIYDECLKLNKENKYKINFSTIEQVKPIYNNITSELLNSYYYLSDEFLNNIKNNININNIFKNLLDNIGLIYTIDFNLKNLSEGQKFRNQVYNILYTLGLPYITNSELGDTIHLKNDFIANCYDSFLKIGILIEMVKRLNYPIIENTYNEVISLTNLPISLGQSKLQNILIDCIHSEYEFLSKITNIDTRNITIALNKDTKKAICTNNIVDFYYHYFIEHFENGTLDDLVKKEELNIIRKMFEEKYSKISDEKRRNEMLQKIRENDSYLKQLFKQQQEYKNVKE